MSRWLLPVMCILFSGFASPSRPLEEAREAVLDEVVAVVGSVPILASDVDLLSIVGVLTQEPLEAPSEFRSRLIEARVRLELQYRDLESTGALFRLELRANTTVERFLARLSEDAALTSQLADRGLTLVDVSNLGVRLAAVSAYVEQRLRPRTSIPDAELQTAYEELVDSLPRGEPHPTIDTVEDQLRRLLRERRLNADIERWLVEAAERHEVIRFTQ